MSTGGGGGSPPQFPFGRGRGRGLGLVAQPHEAPAPGLGLGHPEGQAPAPGLGLGHPEGQAPAPGLGLGHPEGQAPAPGLGLGHPEGQAPPVHTPPGSNISDLAALAFPGAGRGRGRGLAALSVEVPAQANGPPPAQQQHGHPIQPEPSSPAQLPHEMGALQIEEDEAGAMGRGMGRGAGGRGRGNLLPEEQEVVSTGSGSSATRAASGSSKRAPQSDPSAIPSAAAAVQKSSSRASAPSPALPTFEPMRGTNGAKIPVTTNFLKVKVAADMGIFEYHVDFEPQFDSIAICRRMVHKMEADLGRIKTFDGAKLCLPQKLPSDVTTFEVENPNNADLKVKIHVKYVKELPVEECIHFYNILLRKVLELTELKEINRNYFDAKNVHELPQHRLEIWSGYDTAVDKYEGGLMVCVETLHRVLRKTTSLEYLKSLKSTFTRPQDWKEKFCDAVVGRSILTRYNNKFYKVDDVNWDSNPTKTFLKKKTQEQISFVDYFQSQYGLEITDKTQPMLVSRIKPRRNDPTGETQEVLLVPEFSYMTGLTEEITSNFNIMKDLIARTRISPMDRQKHIEEFIGRIIKCEPGSKLLADWGLSLDATPVKMEARKIDGKTIKIRFNARTTRSDLNDNDFARQSTSAPCYRPVDFDNWIVFTSAGDQDKARKMVDMIKSVVGQLDIKCASPQIIVVKSSGRFPNGGDYTKQLKESAQQDKVQFLMAILPQQRDELYSAVKKYCLAQNSIPSQVVIARTLANDKRMRSIVQKIVLQVNCKLGGALWGLDIPSTVKIMFVGIDAYHDPKMKNKSCLAMVASMDTQCSRHFSKMTLQPAHQEASAVIGPLFHECLVAYYEANRGYPDRIIVFRDGVGDGQMKQLLEQEIEPIKTAVRQLCGTLPKFAYVVVQKRINERIFKSGAGRNLDNPDPGTVVDHTITRHNRYDYFLISQLVRQGTVGPTHYTVLDDSGEKKPDLLQKFSYALTFMYFNWPGTIRVPAVCQCAHKLAYLIGQHVLAVPKPQSDNKLYYL